jgi:hypothetical protein
MDANENKITHCPSYDSGFIRVHWRSFAVGLAGWEWRFSKDPLVARKKENENGNDNEKENE